jgi:hypothetical protein
LYFGKGISAGKIYYSKEWIYLAKMVNDPQCAEKNKVEPKWRVL